MSKSDVVFCVSLAIDVTIILDIDIMHSLTPYPDLKGQFSACIL